MQSDGGTDPFMIDIFKINFSKTTMGISKKTEILQTTENSEPTEILKVNDCARALAKNLAASNKLAVKGEALLKAIDKTDIPDKMLEEIKRSFKSPLGGKFVGCCFPFQWRIIQPSRLFHL